VHFGSAWFWIGFNLFVLAMLALDLGVFHRKAHAVTTKEAALWSAVWVGLALTFNAALYAWQGPVVALEFLTGYLIEKALSVDNIFVFLMIFTYFQVPAAYQHRVLFWGILGALIMRGIFIAAGTALLARFVWTLYVFGAFLVVTGLRMCLAKTEGMHPEANPLVRFFRRLMPVTEGYVEDRFFVRRGGVLFATPLLLVLMVVESTDLVFALDSIPAIFGVTRDPFIVYTSNIFAILGLRALYFLLAHAMEKFRYLKFGLGFVLLFIGVKMIVAEWVLVPIRLSLFVVACLLGASVLASLIRPPRAEVARDAESGGKMRPRPGKED